MKLSTTKHVTKQGVVKRNPSLKVGDKVHLEDRSWDDRSVKFVVNATILSISKQRAEGDKAPRLYATILPDTKSVNNLGGSDFEEYAEMIRKPSVFFHRLDSLKKGWVEKPINHETGQYGLRRIGPREGTVGYLNDYEAKAQPFEFAYGTVWATSLEEAKKILAKELEKNNSSTKKK